MNGPWKWVNGPCPIHLHAKIKILMGHLKFWLAIWKKRWAQETLISTLQQNGHQIWIAYVWGPAKNKIRITLITRSFFIKWHGPIPDISLLWPYFVYASTVKPVLSSPSKTEKTQIWMTNGSKMKVESIAECSRWSILQYFWPALSDHRS